MTVASVATWTGSYAMPSGFVFPLPASRPLQVPITNTAGDWVFAVIAWRPSVTGSNVSVCVADDAHNWWEPLGPPNSDSSAAGAVRVSVWAAPAARVTPGGTTVVQVAATGPVLSLAVTIADMSGILPWYSVAAISTGFINASTTLSVSAGAPSAQAVLFTGFASDNNSFSISGLAGWTALTAASASNGVDHTADIKITPGWQVTSSAPSASVTAGGSLDLAGVIAGVLVSATQPAQPNPNWPVTVTEAAIGSGVLTPPSQMTWTSLGSRSLALQVTQGKSYSAGQLQAGQGTILLDDPDGALIPPGTGSFAGIDSGTPLRRRIIWPLAPVSAGIADGTFESGVTAWQAFNGTVAQSSAQHHTGSFSAQLTATTGVSSTYLRPVTADYVPVIPGSWYTCDLWVAPAQAGTTFQAVIDWYDATTTFISSSSGPTASPGSLTWTEFKVTGVAPAGAAYARYGPTMAPTTIGNGYYCDDVLFGPAFTPWYTAFSGYFRRWPWNTDAQMVRGQVQAEIADVWAYGNGSLNSMAIEECLIDSPQSLWPMTDPAGSVSASNVVPNGASLNLTVSKYGTGGASVTWGANSGGLPGMSSATVTASGKSGGGSGMFFQQLAGAALNTGGYGSALTCASQAFPAVTGGVTIEVDAQMQLGATQAFTAGTSGIFAVANSLAAGQAVVLANTGGTFPTGVTAGTIYYVLAGGTSFDLATTPGGPPVTISVAGTGSMTPTVPWNPVFLAARGINGTVAGLEANKVNGNLILRYRPSGATSDTLVTVDTSVNYRNLPMERYSLAFTQFAWRVLVSGGAIASASGTFSSALPGTFTTICYGGVMDRQLQGLTWTGYLALGGIYPGFSSQQRAVNRFWAAVGMQNEAACDRIERILEYTGLTGRRWLGQQVVTYEGDLCASGQDIGGQAAVSSMSNIAQSTLPAILYVAPTGDIVYRSKLYAWNEPVKWTLGDNTAGGEIPFTLGSAATDYDPARVTAAVQLTQLDTSTVTVPAGIMSATTMAAVAAVAGNQYGGQPYQNTGYLTYDWSSAYNAGGSLQDLANWVQAIYAKPQNRVQSVTVDAARHPAAWPFWAGACTGDMVTVNVRMPTASTTPLISLTARITQTARSSKFAQDGSSATITATLDFAPEYRTLICDDATRGLLNGTNVMPWLRHRSISRPRVRGPRATW